MKFRPERFRRAIIRPAIFRPNITSKLTLVIVLFSALLMIVVSALAYTNGRTALKAATLAGLNSSAFEKQSTLNNWIAEKEARVSALAASPDLQLLVSGLTASRAPNAAKDQAQAGAAHAGILAELQPWSGAGQDFLGWIVMDPISGQVMAATDASEEGKFRDDQAYFINGKNGVTVQNPYYSTDAQAVMFTVAGPIYSAAGKPAATESAGGPAGGLLVGVLAGHLDLNKINAIIGRRTGLRQSEDAFLVNTSGLFVTQPRFVTDPAILQRSVHTEAVNSCLLLHASGMVTALDYRGIPAYIVYHWLPERELCLIVKMDQAEALAPAISFGNTILLISILAFLAASVLALWLAHTITRRVQTLKLGVESFGQGKLDLRIAETSHDELGQLAHEFNQMADSLSQKDAQIHAYATGLEQKVQERTAQLAASEERYRTVADFTYDWEYWRAPNGEMLYVSPSCERITGYRNAEFVENPGLMDNIVHPDDRPVYAEHQALVQNNCNDLSIHEADFRIVRRDGEVHWIGHTCQFICRPDGTGLGLRATNRDITERKNSEGRIRRLTRVLNVLSDIDQAIVRLRNTAVLFEFVCRMAVEKGGFILVWIGLADPATGKIIPAAQAGNSKDYLDKLVSALNDTSQGPNPILKLLQSGQPCLCNDLENDPALAFLGAEIKQLGFRSAVALPLQISGEWRGLINLYSGDLDFFDDDELKLLDEMAMDLSYAMEFANQEVKRRRAEEVIESLAKIPGENPNPNLRIQSDGTLLYANEASFSGLKDWKLEIGRSVPTEVKEVVIETLAGGIVKLIDIQQGQRIISFYVTPFVDAGYANLYGRDVTDSRHLEQALKKNEAEIQQLNAELEQRVLQRTNQLESANKELEAFAYSVSHDLRAPLRAIDGFSRIIVDDYAEQLDSEGIRLLNVVRTNTAKMDQLITDLLTLSRTTRSEMKFSRIDMATMANSIYHEVSTPEVREKFTLSVSPLPDAYGDPTLLRQVWANLLSNAIKFTLPKGERRIEVGGYGENEMNVYFVKDNGVGFNPEYTHKLFGVFQRLHKSADFEGTGVGLAIVQRIILRHEGKVWAEGTPGLGATFYFSLPAIAGDKP